MTRKPSKAKYDPARDMPRLDGRVAIVTGGYSGIGLEMCRELLKHGAVVYMFVRTPARAEGVIKQLETDIPDITGKKRVKYIQVDLSSMQEVKRAGEEFLQCEQRLDILVHNAGRIPDKNIPYTLTEEGIEVTYAVNHLAVAVLTRTLLPLLEVTPGDVRVIVISSIGHRHASSSADFTSIPGWNATTGNSYNKKNLRYSMSKAMSILWVSHARVQVATSPKLQHVMFMAVHPGFVKTDGLITASQAWLVWIARRFAMTPREGAYTQLFAATAPEVRQKREQYDGKYIIPFGKVQEPKKVARGKEKAKILWESTEKIMNDLLERGSEPLLSKGGNRDAESGQ